MNARRCLDEQVNVTGAGHAEKDQLKEARGDFAPEKAAPATKETAQAPGKASRVARTVPRAACAPHPTPVGNTGVGQPRPSLPRAHAQCESGEAAAKQAQAGEPFKGCSGRTEEAPQAAPDVYWEMEAQRGRHRAAPRRDCRLAVKRGAAAQRWAFAPPEMAAAEAPLGASSRSRLRRGQERQTSL